MDHTVALRRAEKLEAAGQLVEAEHVYRELLKSWPAHAALLHNLGLLLQQQGRLDDAEAALRQAIASDSGDASYQNSLGALLHTQKKITEAERAYRTAVELRANYPDPRYNLGVLLEEQGRNDEALAQYREAVRLQPRYGRALTRIGVLLSNQGATDAALEQLDKATAVGPHYFDSHYSKGVVLAEVGRFEEALAAFKRAATLRPASFETVIATANTLRDMARNDEALKAYWRAIEIRPDWAPTHEAINRLAWASGRRDLYLRSFDYARQNIGEQANLLFLEAAFCMRQNGFQYAEKLLRKACLVEPERGDIIGLLARSLAGQRKFEDAHSLFVQAIALQPLAMIHRQEFAFSLLRDNQPLQALHVLEQALGLNPFDQIALAELALAYRALGDSRHQSLVNYSQYVRVYDLAPPSGFADRHKFNLDLAEELRVLHTSRVEPIDQSLRGGTQTSGNLFAVKSPCIQAIKPVIDDAIRDYINSLPAQLNHPMSKPGSESFELSGSWSCSLNSQGYHANHVHPKGWISSAYYVSLPDGVNDKARRHGWLKFGESNQFLGENDLPDLFVKPEVGRLILFPSFYWHGTVPFLGQVDRVTIAFDAIPGGEAARGA